MKNVFLGQEKVYRPKQRPKLIALTGALNYTFLTKNMGFIVYLAFLGMLYIANSHQANKTIFEIKALKEETKKNAWESNSTRSDLMFNSMQSEVAEKAAHLGLYELTERPKKIVLDKD